MTLQLSQRERSAVSDRMEFLTGTAPYYFPLMDSEVSSFLYFRVLEVKVFQHCYLQQRLPGSVFMDVSGKNLKHRQTF